MTNRQETTYNAVDLEDVVLTLIVVTGGMILAIFICIIEKAYYTFNSSLKSNNLKKRVKKSGNNLHMSKLHRKFQKKRRNTKLQEY
ncbi:hypothetical protein DMN91_011727 [Ooceraea biroi]|uniref:Uncharacterized protein n=3 Tax=Ooceraea biroi TaxID=2015173 RepID=A0A3L8D6T6_OOCBI|nr:hypothetical protein DMN91_011727 [Ooceraea biroi]